MKRLAPSILSADFARLGEEIKTIENAGAHLVHVDVMDGRFVPNITIGPLVVRSIVGKTSLPLDVHLMIEDPDRYISEFVTPQTEIITVHQEACTHLHKTIQTIKSHGIKAGLALNPATLPETLEYIMDDIDLVLVMSVNPGFGGQSFIKSSLKKVKSLCEMRSKGGYGFEIEIDGGVGMTNIKEISQAGVDIFVAGSAVFGAKDISMRVKDLINLMNI
jgi:ribulose-phosphate 3-epimerase